MRTPGATPADPGEEELSPRAIVVDGAPDRVPHLRFQLPLVNQDRRFEVPDQAHIARHKRTLRRNIHREFTPRPLARGRRLPDAFGPLQGDRGKVPDDLVEQVIDDSTGVTHR